MNTPDFQPGQHQLKRFNRRRAISAGLSVMTVGGMSQAISGSVTESFKNPFDTLKYFTWHDPDNRQSLSIKRYLPSSKATDTGYPVVFLFGGNGMGGVVKSDQAEQMATALNLRGVAALVVNYPNLTDATTFREAIIKPIHDLLMHEKLAEKKCFNVNQVAFAGFSAGGLIATLLATKYNSDLPVVARASVNYYGPVDLRLWFAFHQARSSAGQVPDTLKGHRSAGDFGHSVSGLVPCHELSRRLVAKVSENIGGLAPGKLGPFSHDWLWNDHQVEPSTAKTPVMGVFGMNDDNCDPVFQSQLIKRMKDLSGTPHESRFYQGPHGMGWQVSPDAMDWLVGRLKQDDDTVS